MTPENVDRYENSYRIHHFLERFASEHMRSANAGAVDRNGEQSRRCHRDGRRPTGVSRPAAGHILCPAARIQEEATQHLLCTVRCTFLCTVRCAADFS